ncbi:fertility inhibition FinO-like protein [Nostoc linckia z18]|uniref:Fertility inhibition FinO-like protein n=2 Tax=Nostoc linckia TaxID=92942 RepID=A0A9Q5Z7H5_NOSLI|nr:fertility inhibition FinO-like protein [Nostoc linckia]PHK37465.1 fertility inhibition FinO-like protein [Nostoc linckia z15]PHK43271.1 fertility inhibition FinO-like protein [Nostoc linckia z16]PHJ56172.1 fertility inhibition FinO-like protein [Nostoc linckia z1]PHJ57748.1 fertility inhibition FinO-like protein [Nostoc linckia z3]PHJ59889.1 fertility inhibition FinO-like protein [Nostoc linckia z2]
MIAGKLEVTIKINELPEAKTVENGWQQFELDCDGRIVSITVKPKIWKKLTDAANNYPQWVAAIAGKLGQETDNGFVLDEPNIQVFERKPKAEATAAPGAA